MKFAFFIPLLAVLGAWFYNAYTIFEVGKVVHSTSPNCKAVRGAQGVEDLVIWKGNVITGNLASTDLWLWPGKEDPSVSDPASVPSGALFQIRGLDSDSPSLEKLEISGFPAGVALHPHGLGLVRGEDLLFVVNHGYAKGGERVDVFRLSQKETNGKITLTYVSSVTFSADYYGVLNDVVPISKDEFYVTRWLPWAETAQGRSLSVLSKLKSIAYLVNPFGVKWTSIIHCRGSSGSSETLCHLTGTKGVMWNGITSDGKSVFAYDLLENTVFEFQRTKDGDLVDPKPFPLGKHFGDNLDYNFEDGQIWFGGMANLFKCYVEWVGEYEHNPGVLPKGGPTPSGVLCPSHASSLDPKTGKVTTHLVHDGSLIAAASAAVNVGSKIVIGTWIDEGIIICAGDSAKRT